MKYSIDKHKTLARESYFFKTELHVFYKWHFYKQFNSNNSNLRYHKDQKKNQNNCIELPVFKSQIYWVGHHSNQKLLHFNQHAKNQVSSLIQF